MSSECDRKAPYGEAMTPNRVETPQEKKNATPSKYAKNKFCQNVTTIGHLVKTMAAANY